ncbi:MAG: alginate O-acetyltransferase, partial [Methylobacteriaceae bacterium]|nr:alginate O-acetyltransferase [Methylobacteriaceae bacterium]
MTVWNLTVAAMFPRLIIRNWNQLYGLVEETSPPPTLSNFVSGDVQAAVSRQIGAALPIYAPAVRTRNQIEYSLFGLVSTPAVVFGREKRLYERAYIDEYCKR